MPHRAGQLLTLLLLIAAAHTSSHVASASPPECATLMMAAEEAMAEGKEGVAIKHLESYDHMRCQDSHLLARAARLGLLLQEASRLWEGGGTEEALRTVRDAQIHFSRARTAAAAAEAGFRAELAQKHESGLLGAWMNVVFVALGALTGGIYLFGLLKTRRLPGPAKYAWFWPPNIARQRQQPKWLLLAAFFCALVVFEVTGSLLYYGIDTRGTHNFHSSPGVFFIFIVSLATFWSLGNTLAISTRQRSDFGNFTQFYRELKRIRQDVEQRDDGTSVEEVYVIDYSPRIGHLSKENIAGRIADTLGEFGFRRMCQSHLLVLPHDELERVYEPLLRRQKKESELEARLEEVKVTYGRIDKGNLAVWRSEKIQSEHYVVSENEGLQYIVIPEPNGTKNQLMGEITYDLNRIKFLRLTAIDYLSEAVTPSYRNGGLCFNVGQENVSRVDVFLVEEEGDFSQLPEDLGCADEDYENARGARQKVRYVRIELPAGLLQKDTPYPVAADGHRLAKVRLVKSAHSNMCSPLSHAVRLAPAAASPRGEGESVAALQTEETSGNGPVASQPALAGLQAGPAGGGHRADD